MYFEGFEKFKSTLPGRSKMTNVATNRMVNLIIQFDLSTLYILWKQGTQRRTSNFNSVFIKGFRGSSGSLLFISPGKLDLLGAQSCYVISSASIQVFSLVMMSVRIIVITAAIMGKPTLLWAAINTGGLSHTWTEATLLSQFQPWLHKNWPVKIASHMLYRAKYR